MRQSNVRVSMSVLGELLQLPQGVRVIRIREDPECDGVVIRLEGMGPLVQPPGYMVPFVTADCKRAVAVDWSRAVVEYGVGE